MEEIDVLPAQVGMILCFLDLGLNPLRSTRASGDDPNLVELMAGKATFYPRKRG